MKQRSRVKSVKSHTSPVTTSSLSGAVAVLGLSTADEEDELSHSDGIPLAYSSKVWLECTGGREMKELGLFQDLLADADAHGNVGVEIEKDIGRTMPLNIFFGGDGAGIDKLRRVLTAYSRSGDSPFLLRTHR